MDRGGDGIRPFPSGSVRRGQGPVVMKRRSAELVRMWKCLITGSVRANIGSRQPGEPGAGRSALTRRPAGACGSRPRAH